MLVVCEVSTFTRFPDMMVIVTCYTIFGTIQTFFVDIIANGDLNAWKLKWDLELLIIVLTVSTSLPFFFLIKYGDLIIV